MISALSALPIVSLSSGERGRITSIYAYGGKLLVGLSTGALQVYHISEPFSPNLVANLNATYKEISTQPIERIGTVQDAGILIILSNSIVSVYDLASYTLDEHLSKTRGATTFATIQGVRFANNNDQVGGSIEESNVTEPGLLPITVSRLAVACKRRLVCYEWRDTEFFEYKEIQLPEIIKSLCFADIDKIICGLSSEFCVVDLISSNITTVAPETHVSTSFAASVGMSYIGIGSRLPPPLCVELDARSSAGVTADTAGDANSISNRNNTYFRENIRKSLLVRDTRTQCIDNNGKLVDDYPQIQWSAPPRALAFSYPYLISVLPNVVEVRNPETTSVLQSFPIANVDSITDGKLLYTATAKKVYRLLASDYGAQIQNLADNGELVEAISLLSQIEPVLVEDKENKLRQLQILLAKEMFQRKEFERALLIFSDISAPPDVVIGLFPDDFEAGEQQLPAEPGQESLVGGTFEEGVHDDGFSQDEIKEAVRALLPYLADTRRKISKLAVSKERVKFHGFELSEAIYGDLDDAAALVDTTLFKCYMITSPALVGPLVRVHNHCDPNVVKAKLSQVGKWRELIDFYFGKKMHIEALQLLRKLSIDNNDNNNSLRGPEPTVQYLQRLNNDYLDIIFEFISWPISTDESYGRDVFLEDTSESLSLSRPKVFKYLLSLPSSTLCIEYLEYLINDLNDVSSLFHNNLGTLYIKSIIQTKRDEKNTLLKLTEFVKTSTNYRVDRILHEVPVDDARFLEIRAILHGRLGEHKKALELYAFGVNDPIKARKYCSDLYETDKIKGQDALHILLILYLDLDFAEEHRQDVLDLLASQGSRMSPIEVISRLPADFRLHEIDLFLQSQLRTFTSKSTSERVDASLLKVHLIRTQEQLLELTQKNSVITNHRTCKVCMKRLGHSVISIFPDEVVVHYGCAKTYQDMLDQELQKSTPISLGSYSRNL